MRIFRVKDAFIVYNAPVVVNVHDAEDDTIIIVAADDDKNDVENVKRKKRKNTRRFGVLQVKR